MERIALLLTAKRRPAEIAFLVMDESMVGIVDVLEKMRLRGVGDAIFLPSWWRFVDVVFGKEMKMKKG